MEWCQAVMGLRQTSGDRRLELQIQDEGWLDCENVIVEGVVKV